jgi:type IV secretion system protein TrbL
MGCSPLHPIQCVTGVAGDAANDAFVDIAKDAASGITDVIKMIATSWLSIPSPFTTGSGTNVSAATDPTSTWLQTQLEWALGAAMILGILAAVTFTIIKAARGKQVGDDVHGIFDSIIRVIAVAVFGDVMVGLLLAVTGDFSSWILNQAGTSYSSLGASLDLTSIAATDPFMVVILGCVVLVGALVQVVIVAGIAAVLPILVGMWPMSAAWSGTEAGNQTWKKHSGWILAAILYKPACAIIYAVSFKMFTGGVPCPQGTTCEAQTNSELNQVLGCLLLLLAALALPALLRLIVPAVAAIGGISGGEALAAGAALATGAVMIAATGGAAAPAAGAGAAGPAGGSAAGGAGAAGEAAGGMDVAAGGGAGSGGAGGGGGDSGGGGGLGSMPSGSGGDDDDAGGGGAEALVPAGASGSGSSASGSSGGSGSGAAGTAGWHVANGARQTTDLIGGSVPDEEA